MSVVYLEIGGNLGNRLLNLSKTKAMVEKHIGKVSLQSSVYETPPWGFDAEQNFFNQILVVKSDLSPKDILKKINYIEQKLGRVRGKMQYMSRTIDIDILFYDNLILDSRNLTIPHPKIQHRKFVLVPLAEINENFIHPKLNENIKNLLENCEDKSVCEKL